MEAGVIPARSRHCKVRPIPDPNDFAGTQDPEGMS
jgi:hypothetical protein